LEPTVRIEAEWVREDFWVSMHEGVAHCNDSLKDEGLLGALEWTWEKAILTPPGICTPMIVVPCGPTTRSMGVTVPHESLSDSFKTAV